MTALFFFNSICQEMGFHEKISMNYVDIDRIFLKYFNCCVQNLDQNYDIVYLKREGNPPLSINNYSYNSIPGIDKIELS